jgi:hypothetical protein
VKSFARIVALTFLFICGYAAWTQQPPQPAPQPQVVTPKAPYTSDKVQLSVKQETILQLTANADQKAFQDHMQDMQTQWTTEEAKIKAWVEEVRKANKWDDTYTYDRAGDKWTHMPKAENKSAEVPKK